QHPQLHRWPIAIPRISRRTVACVELPTVAVQRPRQRQSAAEQYTREVVVERVADGQRRSLASKGVVIELGKQRVNLLVTASGLQHLPSLRDQRMRGVLPSPGRGLRRRRDAATQQGSEDGQGEQP